MMMMYAQVQYYRMRGHNNNTSIIYCVGAGVRKHFMLFVRKVAM